MVVCGETEVSAENFRRAVETLKEVDKDGVTGFQKQIKVHLHAQLTCDLLSYACYSDC